ncbi:unnamed protein product [Albugo candida]|uniref:Uncharacterized protein n=1 Tax=Albugo candida TaxID=65357 RepID=A0A024GUV6_9STRA|nr:unnamed protein product [Albugo candida]|eukprot:CCI50498.1 unnamed protein product [Albugo candida]
MVKVMMRLVCTELKNFTGSLLGFLLKQLNAQCYKLILSEMCYSSSCSKLSMKKMKIILVYHWLNTHPSCCTMNMIHEDEGHCLERIPLSANPRNATGIL